MIKALYEPFRSWSKDGSVYVYSDPHFKDSDCQLMDSDWISPDEQVKIINDIVHKNDTFICLGDVGDISYIAKLKAGRKILIKGNHDAGSENYKRKIRKYDYDFPTKEDAVKALKNGVITGYETDPHEPFIRGYVDNNLFDEVYDGPLMISDKIILSHEPIYGLPWCLNIHGHDHGGKAVYYTKKIMPGFVDDTDGTISLEKACICHFVNVAANVCGYTPVSLGQMIKEGILSDIPTIHRLTIDKAEKKKQERKTTGE